MTLRSTTTLTLAFACCQVQAQNHSSTRLNIPYTQGVHAPLLADAYLPAGPGPFPAILYIHGGGWIDGNRNQMLKVITPLTEAGYVGFTIEYDLDPDPYPTSFLECLAAVRYMRTHAAELHIDPERIAVMGSSAGGELAALVALNPAGPAGTPSQEPTANVQAAVLLDAVLDLPALGDKTEMVTRYLGGTCSTHAAACEDASPTNHVRAGAPPIFVGQGTADAVVPYAHAKAFVDKLRAANVPVTFYEAPGGSHIYWFDQFFEPNLSAMKQFLRTAMPTPAP